ncbi:dnaJ-like protein 60 [Coccinella septempunctata]|uniref:dnaJ-like protein 60 n=1 Tax=Coccinella septempunctata TaxID=41139 RepID=UPI001D07A139|nr:dnaJ-like protein 60 [Coccinella septempunctata]
MFHLNSTLIRNVIPVNNYYLIFWRPQTTFYDVLHLKKDCSSKEIKDSYIKLSKLYHPDRTVNSKSAHQKFVKINEAYNTLSKPHLRRNYDMELESPPPIKDAKSYHDAYDFSMYENPIFKRHKSRTNDEDGYYGFKGIKKQPHFVIVLLCAGIALVGLSVQLALVKNSVTFRREQLKRDSEAYESILEEVKKTSELNGRELQIEILKRKFEENELQRRRSN